MKDRHACVVIAGAALSLAILSPLGCGDDGDAEDPPRESKRATAARRLVEAPEARALLDALRERHDILDGASEASFDVEGARLAVRVPAGAASSSVRRADIALPLLAAEPFTLSDVESGVEVRVRLVGASDARAELADGHVVYRHALGPGTDVVHRVSTIGTEDFVAFDARPASEELRYEVELGEHVAGLRLVARTLELLDAGGAPRLRVAPPYVVDAQGTRHEAHLELDGCDADRSPVAPWGRAATSPRSRRCEVRVAWGSDAPLDYPLVVDPSWTTTGSFTVARYAHTASLLPTGLVLIAGGSGSDGDGPWQSARLFDPISGTWATTGSMAIDRAAHVAATLLDGRVLVQGGSYSGGTTASAEVYNPMTGTWMSAGGEGQRSGHTATRLADGRVLIVGGYPGLQSASLFDPTTDDFASADGLTLGRGDHTATLLPSGRVLVAGGVGSSTIRSSAEVYDPGTDTWSSAGTMNVARYEHGASLLGDGTVLIAGGGYTPAAGVDPAIANAERYDPAGGTWTVVPSMSVARARFGLVTLTTGQALAAGGTTMASASPALASAEVFDHDAGTWLPMPGMATPRESHTATLLANGRVLVAGGTNDTGTPATVHASAELFALLADGVACAQATDCASGICSPDAVCCDVQCAGSCVACTAAKKGSGADGVCGPIAGGSDPDAECAAQPASTCGTTGTCSGGSTCSLHPQGTTCAAPSCTAGTESSFACNGGGSCIQSNDSCAPYTQCSGSVCATTCAADGGCVAASWCDVATSACEPDQPNGDPCTSASQCISASCVDGVCCDQACGGLCQGCSAAAKGQGPDGVCGAVQNGADPDDDCDASQPSTCDEDGACNGAGACRLHQQGTSCGATLCNGNLVVGQICNGFGTCTDEAGGFACSPYRCEAGGCLLPCDADTDCVDGTYFCDAGTCTPKKLDGLACDAGNECLSTRCVDGVCCDQICDGACQGCSTARKNQGPDGVCGPVQNGTDPDGDCAASDPSTCGDDGACNGASACRKHLQGTGCGDTSCNGNFVIGQICDGFGACNDEAGGFACFPYRCDDGGCLIPCGADTDCADASYFCDAGVCTAKNLSGVACDAANECLSGFCVDGVCCSSACNGTCQACLAEFKASGVDDGVCGAAAEDTDLHDDCEAGPVADCDLSGVCDGRQQCALYAAGTTCLADDCQSSAPRTHACDGTGTCVADPADDCAPFGCSAGACLEECATSSDCAEDAYCESGTCTPEDEDGATCDGPESCASGQCVDGVCCSAACTGQCEACDLPTAVGTCSPVFGAPRGDRPACDAATGGDPCSATSCDGEVSTTECAALAGADVSCRESSCAGGVETRAEVCDGSGACPAARTKVCEPYVCGDAECRTSCEDDFDCAAGTTCDVPSGKCVSGASCDGDHTIVSPDGTPTECAPYRCEGSSCKTTCASVDDCAQPNVCDPSGECVSADSAGDGEDDAGGDGGCGCRLAGAPGGDGHAWLAALLGVAWTARRRARPEAA